MVMLNITCHRGYAPVNESCRMFGMSFANRENGAHQWSQLTMEVIESISIKYIVREEYGAVECPSKEWCQWRTFECHRYEEADSHYDENFQRASAM